MMPSQEDWDELDKIAQFLGYKDVWNFLATAPQECFSGFADE